MTKVEKVAMVRVDSKRIHPPLATQLGIRTVGVSRTLTSTAKATPNIVTANKKIPNMTTG